MKASFFSSFSHLGSRPAQEDHLLVDLEKGIFIVSDGFGGPVPGNEAAQSSCSLVKDFLFRGAGDVDATLPFILRNYFSLAANVLFNALIYANQKMFDHNRNRNINERGGASVFAGLLDGDLLSVANVGVCSAWLFRDNLAKQLVVPRNFARLVDPFSMQEGHDQAVPLIALGMFENLEPEICEYKVKSGDWLILHTDGIPMCQEGQMVQEIKNIKQKNLSKEDSAKETFSIVKADKMEDNGLISLVIF